MIGMRNVIYIEVNRYNNVTFGLRPKLRGMNVTIIMMYE